MYFADFLKLHRSTWWLEKRFFLHYRNFAVSRKLQFSRSKQDRKRQQQALSRNGVKSNFHSIVDVHNSWKQGQHEKILIKSTYLQTKSADKQAHFKPKKDMHCNMYLLKATNMPLNK